MIDKTKRAVSTGVLEDGDDGAFGRKRQNNNGVMSASARGCCEMPRSIARVRRVEGGVGWTGALGTTNRNRWPVVCVFIDGGAQSPFGWERSG
jgi:hypothetical protein